MRADTSRRPRSSKAVQSTPSREIPAGSWSGRSLVAPGKQQQALAMMQPGTQLKREAAHSLLHLFKESTKGPRRCSTGYLSIQLRIPIVGPPGCSLSLSGSHRTYRCVSSVLSAMARALPKEVMWRIIQFVDDSSQLRATSSRWKHVGRGNSSMETVLRSKGSIPNELLVGLVLQFLDEPDAG